MPQKKSMERTWVRVGIVSGFLASLIYPILILVPLPRVLAVALVGAFGILLGLASVGLYHVLVLHRKTVSLQVGVASNVIAGTLVNMMLFVQMAIRSGTVTRLEEISDQGIREALRYTWLSIDRIQLGLDVLWDVYIGLGTLLIALNMLSHPRFGRLFGWSGTLIAVLLLGFNLYTFPTPPADAGLIDIGPFVGLWYFAVAIQVLRSLRWIEEVRSLPSKL